MFEDDEDFEIDEEFLDGVYDAEKSAINNDITLDHSRSSPNHAFNGELEPSPVKKRKSSPISFPPSSFQERQTPALRTSEETARLVATAAQRRAPSQGINVRDQFAVNRSENVFSNESNLRNSSQASATESNLFKRPQVNNSPSPENHHGSRSPPKNRFSSESFNLNTSRVRQRKFPGPAGLLPERGRSHGQGQRPNFSSLLNTSGSDMDEAEEPLSLCSQSTASVLEDGPWLTLRSDFAGGGHELLERYSVSWVKQKAAARQLVGQKVPFLAAVLHSIDCSSPDPCVVLRDSTGEIPGTLHRSVWDSFGGQLIAGSALVLRFVGVLSTGISARRHYLNITSNNIVTIYSSPLCESSTLDSSTRVRKTDVHKWALSQLLQAANNWEEQSKRNKDTGASPSMVQRSVNPFSSNTFSPGNAGSSASSARPPLQTSNRTNISGSVSNTSNTSNTSTSSAMRPPAQVPGRSNNISSGTSRVSLDGSIDHSSGRPLMQTTRSFTPGTSTSSMLPGQQNFDPLRQNKNVPSTVSNTASAVQNKFVPKRPSFPFGGLDKTDKGQQSSQNSVQEPHELQTSRDMFSDADDIDISSVLDGIDSESLFGDF